jgi:hypothetical protein
VGSSADSATALGSDPEFINMLLDQASPLQVHGESRVFVFVCHMLLQWNLQVLNQQ